MLLAASEHKRARLLKSRRVVPLMLSVYTHAYAAEV